VWLISPLLETLARTDHLTTHPLCKFIATGRRYAFFPPEPGDVQVGWVEANQSCSEIGGSLATVEDMQDEAELSFLSSVIGEKSATQTISRENTFVCELLFVFDWQATPKLPSAAIVAAGVACLVKPIVWQPGHVNSLS
jgi:hypothetical protein